MQKEKQKKGTELVEMSKNIIYYSFCSLAFSSSPFQSLFSVKKNSTIHKNKNAHTNTAHHTTYTRSRIAFMLDGMATGSTGKDTQNKKNKANHFSSFSVVFFLNKIHTRVSIFQRFFMALLSWCIVVWNETKVLLLLSSCWHGWAENPKNLYSMNDNALIAAF